MARIAKITLYVSTTQNAQSITVRSTGKRGNTMLNNQFFTVQLAGQSPFDTSLLFWTDVLTKVLPHLV